MLNNCPLCEHKGLSFYNKRNRIYYQCSNCSGIFVDRQLLPDWEAEEGRYKEHNNNVEDKGYQKFVSPITKAVLRDFTAQHKGLDFGAGTGPVISKVLTDNKYTIKLYDPFFHKNPEFLEDKYDYIVCCEVMEHFHDPKKEFALLKKMLNPGGKLYCLTHLYEPTIVFDNWYYKNDLTHVFIYHRDSLAFIKKEFGFSDVTVTRKLITFSV